MMQFEKNILVVNRITLVMDDTLVQKWGAAANADRDRTAYATAIIMARLQHTISLALVTENPEACCRGEILWTERGAISITGLFVIASGADAEVLNHFEDHDYLNHLHTIRRVAQEAGFKMTVQPVKARFPFNNTVIPMEFKGGAA